jgi:hypothetical protein
MSEYWISNYLKFAMKTWVVIMSAMIIVMTKTNTISRGSNKTNERMSWKGIQEIKTRDSVYFLKKDAGRMISSLSTQAESPKNMVVITA